MATTIRAACREDIEAINDILNYSILHEIGNVAPEARSYDAACQWFDAHDERHPILVLEEDGMIAAWGSLSSFRANRGYDRTTEHSVYVRNGYRRKGYGRVMLRRLMQEAARCGFDQMIAVITAENRASEALHAAEGFKKTGLLPRAAYKDGRYLDILLMQWTVEG